MKRLMLLVFVTGFFTTTVLSQVPKKRLSQNINVPNYSHIFPSLSGDGNQIIYLTNYTNSEKFEAKYSFRTGLETWEDPELITQINKPGLDHVGSFCLSHDGNFVVFSSRRAPNIGNYDIWISEKKGSYWSAPVNPGKPLNSPSNEGNPSLSPDGKSIYFMRCEQMDTYTKSNCSIYVSHRTSATRWSEPERLPSSINIQHETTPRILADNQTLVFASGRAGGRGKLDLYSSRIKNGRWSAPKSMSFINSPENDEFISIPARGDIIYFTAPYRNEQNIYKAIIPEEFRPEKVLMLSGTVHTPNGLKPSEGVLVQAFSVKTGRVYTTTRPRDSDNTFTIFLPEGEVYDVSVFPQKGGLSYFSSLIDLKHILISRKEELEINLEPLRPGKTIPLTTVRYANYTATLTSDSDIEVKRIIGFLKKNPRIKVEIGAYIDKIYADSVASNDLSEVTIDTSFVSVPLASSDNRNSGLDAPFQDTESATSSQIGKYTIADSLLLNGYWPLDTTNNAIRYYKIKQTFHNDRTQQQADALMQCLIDHGVPRHMLSAVGYGDNWNEDRAYEERNYWIELKILGM